MSKKIKKTKQTHLTPLREKKERPERSVPKTVQTLLGKPIPKIFIDNYDYKRKGKEVFVEGYWRKTRGKNKPKRKLKKYMQSTIMD